MKLEVIVLPEAKAEATEAALWHEANRTGQGDAHQDAIDDALRRISESPERYPSWRRGLPFRRMLLARFPYLSFYTIADSSVEVHAIAHPAQRPGYWLKR